MEPPQPGPLAVRPTPPRWRILKAYMVTLVVLSSYLWLRFKSRYRSNGPADKALERIHRRNARRINRAILELQGLYIKVGQLFSIMTNILPEAFRTELAALQDQVPARPFHEIERRFREEFEGKGPLDLFESFDQTPIASASIGQVHRATLPGGHAVAVKVQYPDIEAIVRADLQALRRIFSLLHRFIPYQGLDAVYGEVREMVLLELDFTAEARNAEAIAHNFEGRTDVRFPRVVRELTTTRVLTTEFIDAIKISDMEGLRRLDVDRKQLARKVIETYCEQIFHHGVYHADPHPGNIMVSAGPTLHFVDFGAVAELSPKSREGLVSLLQGAMNRDTTKIINAMRDLGFLAHRADPKVYDEVVEYFHEQLHRELKIDSFNLRDLKFNPEDLLENLADLRRRDISLADITDTFRVPKEWIMLERTILLVAGLCTELDPELNPMEVIRPHVEDFVLGKDGDWSQFMLDATKDIALGLVSLPAEIRKFTRRAMQGEIEISISGQQETDRIHHAIGHQLVLTALLISSGTAAIHFEARGREDALLATMIAASTFGLLLLRSMWISSRWVRRRRR